MTVTLWPAADLVSLRIQKTAGRLDVGLGAAERRERKTAVITGRQRAIPARQWAVISSKGLSLRRDPQASVLTTIIDLPDGRADGRESLKHG